MEWNFTLMKLRKKCNDLLGYWLVASYVFENNGQVYKFPKKTKLDEIISVSGVRNISEELENLPKDVRECVDETVAWKMNNGFNSPGYPDVIDNCKSDPKKRLE